MGSLLWCCPNASIAPLVQCRSEQYARAAEVLRQETCSKIILAVQFSSRCVFFESNDDANEIKNAIDRLFSSEFAQSSGFALGEGRHRDAGSSYDEISAPLPDKNLKLYGSDGDVKRESASDEHKKLVALLRRGQTGETALLCGVCQRAGNC